jgi:uncharacterized C2H2 Zn-finger protein
VDHLLYDCYKLQRERENLIRNVSKQDNWPVGRSDLVHKHIKHFIQFANSVDFEKHINRFMYKDQKRTLNQQHK